MLNTDNNFGITKKGKMYKVYGTEGVIIKQKVISYPQGPNKYNNNNKSGEHLSVPHISTSTKTK